MMMNKDNFVRAFQDKDYLTCIQLLREEIKNILIEKLKAIRPEFEYTSIPQLKEYSLRYLDEQEQTVALKLYHHSFEEIPVELELDDLLEMYEVIK